MRNLINIAEDLQNVSDEIEADIEAGGFYEGRICCLISDLGSIADELEEKAHKEDEA